MSLLKLLSPIQFRKTRTSTRQKDYASSITSHCITEKLFITLLEVVHKCPVTLNLVSLQQPFSVVKDFAFVCS